MTRHKISIFDMDKTITRVPTFTPMLMQAAQRYAPWRIGMLPLAAFTGMMFKLKFTSRQRVKETAHRLMLGQKFGSVRAIEIADLFAEKIVPAQIYPQAIDRIASDKAQGYRIVIATASYRFYAQAIAKRLGIDDVIGTEVLTDPDGTLHSRLDGPNCYGPDKLVLVQKWLAEQGISREDAHIRFYSDHVSDAPCLEFADEPFAVNPHGALTRLARKLNWPILEWRR